MISKTKSISGSSYVVLFLLMLLKFNLSSAQGLSTPLDYMQYISAELKNVQKDTWDYTRAAAHNKSARKIENRRKDLLGSINTAIGKIKRMKGFDGNTGYRDSCLSYLQINKAVIDRDYAKIMELEDIAEQSYDDMEAYMLAQQKANEILQVAGENLADEEKRFANDHHINLIESQDKVTKKLKQSSRVYEYYNKIYLIFFKSYKQEWYLLEATRKGDVNAMEQNKNTLLKDATEGLELLKEIKAFDGDNSVKMACTQLLSFYKEEAEKKYQTIIDFQLKKENFDKSSAIMNNKSSKTYSKEDVDSYNKAVKEYNLSINQVNLKNKELNESRNKHLDNWNSTAEHFTSSHV